MKLRPYQLSICKHLIKHSATFLIVDMGLGKTVCTLTALNYLIAKGKLKRVLIVAPKRVCQEVWPAEIAKWEHVKFSHALLTGSEAKRLKALSSDAQVFIINNELVPWLQKQKQEFDGIVVDESSAYKNPKAARTKAMHKLAAQARWRVCLTGTPTPKSLLDLHSQVKILDDGVRLGKSFYKFRTRVAIPDYSGFKWQVRDEKLVTDAVQDITYSLQLKDVALELPRLIENVHHAEPAADFMKRYKEFKQSLVYELQSTEDSVIAANAAVLANKLAQLTSGALYKEDGSCEYVDSTKLNMLSEMLEETGNTVVVYNFRSEFERLKKKFGGVDVREAGAVEAWNTGDIPVLLLHPASGGHGLNLQYGGSRIIWYNLTWSAEHYQQTIKRLHRSGQQASVLVDILAIRGTIDDIMHARVTQRGIAQEQYIAAFKKHLLK